MEAKFAEILPGPNPTEASKACAVKERTPQAMACGILYVVVGANALFPPGAPGLNVAAFVFD